MKQLELNKILKKHKLWVDDATKGERANLEDANLQSVNLRHVNLKYANLHGANLDGNDLQSANLFGANLEYANLHGADLRYTKLHGAGLYGADLRGANLDFSVLNLSCKGLDFTIDERIAKQLMYHVINLMQYSNIKMPKDVIKFANETHLIEKHKMKKLEEANNEK